MFTSYYVCLCEKWWPIPIFVSYLAIKYVFKLIGPVRLSVDYARNANSFIIYQDVHSWHIDVDYNGHFSSNSKVNVTYTKKCN